MTVWLVASVGAVDRWTPAFEAAGFSPVGLMVSRIVPPRDPQALTRALRAREHDIVLLTSSNAAHYVDPREATGWTAACVGARTAEAAIGAGFDVSFVGSLGAEALAEGLLEAAPGIQRVLFLRGASARSEGPAILRAAGVQVDEVVSYAMAPEPGFERAVLGAPVPDVAVVGSPRAAEALLAVRDDIRGARFVAIGETTRQHLEVAGIPDVRVAASMSIDDLVAAAREGADQ